MLYNSSGSLILDTSVTPSFSFTNGSWYFIAAVIEPDNQKAWYVVGDRSSGTVWTSAALTINGTLNRSCQADLIWGMLNTSYWYAGGFDDWFLNCDADITTDDIAEWFLKSLSANGADSESDVDALTSEDSVILKADGSVYPASGVLTTSATECGISGTGRVSVTADTSPGVTSISLIETSTSDDLSIWTEWISVGTGGTLQSPSKKYIRYRITLATANTARTPVLTGYEHEAWNLGDTVMVVDEDLDLSIKTRIVRREYNLQEPWNTVLELSTTLRELGDSTSQWDAAADVLEGATTSTISSCRILCRSTI